MNRLHEYPESIRDVDDMLGQVETGFASIRSGWDSNPDSIPSDHEAARLHLQTAEGAVEALRRLVEQERDREHAER